MVVFLCFVSLSFDSISRLVIASTLMNHLFDAKWEIRHGAAIGLRAILKKQGRPEFPSFLLSFCLVFLSQSFPCINVAGVGAGKRKASARPDEMYGEDYPLLFILPFVLLCAISFPFSPAARLCRHSPTLPCPCSSTATRSGVRTAASSSSACWPWIDSAIMLVAA
jgi:hypothetical protein